MTPETRTHEIRIERTLKAPVQKVWEALTKKGELSRWYAPSEDFHAEVLEWTLEVGGSYRIAMHAPDGSTHTCFGVFREIVPREKIAYTWSWEGQDPMDSLVVFQIAPQGRETVLRFSHTGLPSAESKEQHDQGWVGCLAQLEALVAA